MITKINLLPPFYGSQCIIHIVSGRGSLFILITYSELSILINESCNHVICIFFSGVNKLSITKLKYKT